MDRGDTFFGDSARRPEVTALSPLRGDVNLLGGIPVVPLRFTTG